MVSHDQSNVLMRILGDWQPVVGPALPIPVEGPVVPMQGVFLVTSPIPSILAGPALFYLHLALGTQVVGQYHLHVPALTSDPRVP